MIAIQNINDWKGLQVESYQCAPSIMSRDGRIVSPFSQNSHQQDATRPAQNQMKYLDAAAPNTNDVLWGRTKKAHGHSGNSQFRRLIRQYRGAYQGTKIRDEKSKVVRAVMARIANSGGRFLKSVDDEGTIWYEVDSVQVYDKVSHALRSAKPSKTYRSAHELHKSGDLAQSPQVESSQISIDECVFDDLLTRQKLAFETLKETSFTTNNSVGKVEEDFCKLFGSPLSKEYEINLLDEEEMAIFLEDVDL